MFPESTTYQAFPAVGGRLTGSCGARGTSSPRFHLQPKWGSGLRDRSRARLVFDWYWRHVAELDRRLDAGRWVTKKSGWARTVERGGRGAGTGFRDHIRHFARAFSGDADPPTGPPPDDALDVLTSLALGSPAVCAERFLLLRSQDDRRYWERIAHYGIEGNLQAVLDEYAHVLVESEGLMDHEPDLVKCPQCKEKVEQRKLAYHIFNVHECVECPRCGVRVRKTRRNSHKCRVAVSCQPELMRTPPLAVQK